MQAEDVRTDEVLRELVVLAFENITGLSSQIDAEPLQRLFNIFHLMYPVLDEDKKHPPKNVSEKMRALLQNVFDEDETSTTGAHEDSIEGNEDQDKDHNLISEKDSNDEGDDGHSDDGDRDEDEVETKR